MAGISPLLHALEEVDAATAAASHLLVFLDFDGTLAPIAESPQRARMPEGTRRTLEALVQCPDCTVSVVSGRALDDVRARVGVDGIIYAGNHGLEIAGGGLCFDEASAVRLKEEVASAVSALANRLERVPGVLVEPKGLSASVHYRRVACAEWDEVALAARSVVPEDHPHLVLAGGKMVWEVRPRVSWNKGTAVRWIRAQLEPQDALAIYLGDDQTDEDAFAAVGRLVSARVGAPGPTRAGFVLAHTEEAAAFLSWLSGKVRSRVSPGGVA